MVRQPSQYASTLGCRLPCSPISSTSGTLPPGARNQISSSVPGTGPNPVMPRGFSVAAYMYAGVPQQHTRGCAAHTHSRPPRSLTKLTASGLTSSRMTPPPRRSGLPLAADAAERVHVRLWFGGVDIGPPHLDRHDAWFNHVQAFEEAGDLFGGAQMVGDRAAFVVVLQGVSVFLADDRTVLEHQVTGGRQAVHKPADDRVWPLVVGDVPHNAAKNERYGLGEIQRARRGVQDFVRLTQVRVDVVGDPLGRAGQQRPGVREHERIIVDIDDPACWIQPLRNLMCVVDRGQAGASVQKLVNISLSYQIVDGPGEKLPVGSRLGDDTREGLDKLVAGLPVDRIVILTAQPVIPNASRVRDSRVDPFHQVFLCLGPRVRRLLATHDNLQ